MVVVFVASAANASLLRLRSLILARRGTPLRLRHAYSSQERTNMNFGDKVLYHQIHPLKLATDFVASLVSLYFFWQHRLFVALILHFVLPIVASLVVIYAVDLEPQKQSAFGQYVKRMMTRKIEAMRLSGDIVMVLGAWFRSLPLIGVGLAVVIAGWLSGIVKAQRQ
jgi:hypothetical protein